MPAQPDTPTDVASAYDDTARLGIEGHSLRSELCSVKPRTGVARRKLLVAQSHEGSVSRGYSSRTGATTTP
jgi:hypothetical protein